MAQTLLEQYRLQQAGMDTPYVDDHADCGCGCGGAGDCGGGTTTVAAKSAKSTDKSVESSGGFALYIPLWAILLTLFLGIAAFVYFRFFHNKVVGA